MAALYASVVGDNSLAALSKVTPQTLTTDCGYGHQTICMNNQKGYGDNNTTTNVVSTIEVK